MRRSLTVYALTLAAALVSPGAQAGAQLRYRVLNLGVPDSYGDPATSLAFALNNHGSVAGTVADPGQRRLERAFLFQDGRMRLLGHLGGLPTSEAVDINDRGQVLGYATDPATSERRLFLYDQGRLTDLSPGPDVNDRTPHALNDAGQVVGAIHSRAFVLDGNGLRFIPFGADVSRSEARAINDRGVVVGQAYVETESAYRAFV